MVPANAEIPENISILDPESRTLSPEPRQENNDRSDTVRATATSLECSLEVVAVTDDVTLSTNTQ